MELDVTTERRAIARYLAAHGPMHGDKLAEAVGHTLERFWVLINCPWFDIVRGGWDITDQGRREALGEG